MKVLNMALNKSQSCFLQQRSNCSYKRNVKLELLSYTTTLSQFQDINLLIP